MKITRLVRPTLAAPIAGAALAALLAPAAAAQCCPAADKVAKDAGCGGDATISLAAMDTKPDIVDTAVAAGSFTTLVKAVQAAGLVDALKGDGPFTVFAPTDAAFAKLPAGTVQSLLKPENKDKLTAVLTYHVVPGRLVARDVVRASGATTLNGQRVDFAFDGSKVTVDGATVSSANIETSNGVIHVIDSVILPASDDIVSIAASNGSFSTLLAAAKAAGLAEALMGDGPYTVLAPTDEAFAKLPAGTVDALLKPENKDQLAAILKYHVIKGRAYANDAIQAGTVPTLQGGKVVFSIRDGRAFVDGAAIVGTDIDASNGVIHVIDTVILPGA